MAEDQERVLTFGEKAVGINFNPGADPKVNEVKELYAKIIDILYTLDLNVESQQGPASFRKAITEAMTAQMWAVKAITWKK